MESVEVIKTPFSCKDDLHRFFALEAHGNEDAKVVVQSLACTLCGSLVVHRIKV